MQTTNLNYDLSYTHCTSQQNLEEALILYRNAFPGKCFSNRIKLSVSESFCNILDIAVQAFEEYDATNVSVTCFDSHTACVRSSELCLAVEDVNYSNYDFWKSFERTVHLRGFGNLETLKNVGEYLKANLKENKLPTVNWEFLVADERRSQEIKIDRPKPIYNEFYPWLNEDVYDYYDRFLNNEASILVLLGETGTAKTSFVRSLIWHGALNTMFTYEEELLQSDSLFVDFIISEQTNLLVIEDADLFLTSRDHDGNKVMSKFLNVSDGLVSIGKKKIIFTANITEPSRIDEALLRAGRCFDCQVFRRLTFDEAVAACRVADIEPPKEAGTYSLSELFSDKRKATISTHKFGFAAR